mmetsp:Transcript_8930/g.36882  ORF Transcript_8930/g.36882 Transcript_8930/m.36882 type:complete len:255 (-) Transcript_8930:2910-3674(-)
MAEGTRSQDTNKLLQQMNESLGEAINLSKQALETSIKALESQEKATVLLEALIAKTDTVAAKVDAVTQKIAAVEENGDAADSKISSLATKIETLEKETTSDRALAATHQAAVSDKIDANASSIQGFVVASQANMLDTLQGVITARVGLTAETLANFAVEQDQRLDDRAKESARELEANLVNAINYAMHHTARHDDQGGGTQESAPHVFARVQGTPSRQPSGRPPGSGRSDPTSTGDAQRKAEDHNIGIPKTILA